MFSAQTTGITQPPPPVPVPPPAQWASVSLMLSEAMTVAGRIERDRDWCGVGRSVA